MSNTPTSRSDNRNKNLKSNQEEIDRIVLEARNLDDLILRASNDRNVMFVGRTRSGKSTAYEVLKSPYIFVTRTSMYSVTRDAKINHFTIEYTDKEKTKINYNISIIDTPGLFEVKKIGDEDARDNVELENIILKCLNSEVTKVHAIFFVASFNEGVNKDDVQALKSFIKLFHGAEKNIWMLITRTESMNEEDKLDIIKDLKSYKDLAELCKLVENRILFGGAVEKSFIDRGHVDTFDDRLQSVIKMRKKMFEEIFKMENSFELNLLNKVDEMKGEIDKKMEKLKLIGDITKSNYDEVKELCYLVGSRRLIYSDKEKLDNVLNEIEKKDENI